MGQHEGILGGFPHIPPNYLPHCNVAQVLKNLSLRNQTTSQQNWISFFQQKNTPNYIKLIYQVFFLPFPFWVNVDF